MIHVGVDLHQRFCYVTAVKTSGEVVMQRSVMNEPESLRRLMRALPEPAQVVMEACGFWPAFRQALDGQVARLVMVHPQRVKAIASARLKNDRVDSATLAHLSRCDLLPEAWMADPATQQMRMRVRLRIALGRQRARSKNLLQAALHQEGMRKPVSDLFGRRGRQWLGEIVLSPAARNVVNTQLRLIAVLDELIAEQERELCAQAAADPRARWLQTIPGVGAYSAMVILAEIGDVARFPHKKSLASYAGLVPRVRESAGKRSYGGITRAGSETLRWILLQVAQVAARSSPAARGYYQRLRGRKRAQVARVALARKLLSCIWALLCHGVCYDDQVFAAGQDAMPKAAR
ncbi:MAG TPA: IS110 family transposase [Candidatus Acidoferrum sp.]|nr:IS110 family transposase [Candidatus Acidoferrum sp.]